MGCCVPDHDDEANASVKTVAASKVLTLADFIEQLPTTGSLALGGLLLENRPCSLVRAVIRAGMQIDLLTSSPVASWDVDILVAAGLVERMRVPHVSLGELGLAPAVSRAARDGAIQIEEADEAMVIGAFLAAGEGAPTHQLSNVGINDLVADNPLLRLGEDGRGEVDACHPDVVLLHAPLADSDGNLAYLGSRYADLILARAGRRVYAQVDAVVPSAVTRRLGVGVPGYLIDGIISQPYAAHPTGSGGCYAADFEHLREYVRAVRSEETADYLARFAGAEPAEDYPGLIGDRRLAALQRMAAR